MRCKLLCCALLVLQYLVAGAAVADSNSAKRGEYLTTILGCGNCHTPGALAGQEQGPWLSGSRVGIAYSGTNFEVSPGIVYPGNLTSDKRTGLGNWAKPQVVRMIRTGRDHMGDIAMPVMPWLDYSVLTAGDVSDIADYLMQLPPVGNQIPPRVHPGEQSSQPYMRSGIYYFSDGVERLWTPEEYGAEEALGDE